MRLKQFLTSKVFFINLGLAILTAIILVWLTMLSLKRYTNHGEEIEIPNLYGLSLEESIQILNKKNLRYTLYDSVYNSDLTAGCVLDQSPKAHSLVKRNRNIFITINSIKPEQIRFPNLVDNSFRQAYQILATHGFKIGELKYVDYDYYNLVLYPEHNGDTINQGDLIEKGSTIDLVLGKGNNIKILFPDLIGKTYKDAKEHILLSNLNIGEVNFDHPLPTLSDSLNAKVYIQTHNDEENIRLAPGSRINLWLTTDSLKVQDAKNIFKEPILNQ